MPAIFPRHFPLVCVSAAAIRLYLCTSGDPSAALGKKGLQDAGAPRPVC